MIGIAGLIALLTTLALSLVITRVATTALILTGLSEEAARFQARSAFTGTGFTTGEAEYVVRHPVRRRIIAALMLMRSAGLVTVLISLILSFAGPGTGATKLYRLLWLVGGAAVLWLLSISKSFGRALHCVIEWALKRWTDLDVRDYASLLRLSGQYRVSELQVEEGDWLAGRTLRSCDLHEEGVTVLGILRDDGTYVGVPGADTEIYPEDTLILYGRSSALSELDRRLVGSAGDMRHQQAADEHRAKMVEQSQQEERHKAKRAAEAAHKEGQTRR